MCEFEDFSFVIVVPSKLRQNDYYKQVYIMWMYLLIMYLIPFLSLMIFNTFIYREVSLVGGCLFPGHLREIERRGRGRGREM